MGRAAAVLWGGLLCRWALNADPTTAGRKRRFPKEVAAVSTFEAKATVLLGGSEGMSMSQLNSPTGIAFGEDGQLFVADTENRRCLKWDIRAWAKIANDVPPADESFETKELKHPQDITLSSDGKMFIVDSYAHAVFMWTGRLFLGKPVTVVAGGSQGPGYAQLDTPKGAVVDTTTGDLYVVEFGNHRITKWRLNSNPLSSITEQQEGKLIAGTGEPGTGLAQLSHPSGIALDNKGVIYVSDTGNHRVVKWFPKGTRGAVVAGGSGRGSGLTQLNTPVGLFVDSTRSSLFVVDQYNHRVVLYRLMTGGTPVVVAGGNGQGEGFRQLNMPTDVVLVSGYLIISDSGNARVLRYDPIHSGNRIGNNSDARASDGEDGEDVLQEEGEAAGKGESKAANAIPVATLGGVLLLLLLLVRCAAPPDDAKAAAANGSGSERLVELQANGTVAAAGSMVR
jgi:sugar lactone lactonase YvrE